jgi:hypothetical protein
MYESLKEHTKDFHLFIFAFDDISYQILKRLNLDYTTIISLGEFENPELLNVKPTRSVAEYCWTCTPSTISYVLDRFKVSNCTYIDADLIFYSDPAVLVDEMYVSRKSVLITEHRFSRLPGWYEEKRGGRFCVQFVTFTDSIDSLDVLETWRLQCIDWCYSRYEEGRFGDQKYLDEWPGRYKNVHILQHQGGGVAPWNTCRYKFRKENNSITGVVRKNKQRFEVVFYHFQYVKLLENGKVDIGWYIIPEKIKSLFYRPYLESISKIEKMLLLDFPAYKTGFTRFKPDNIKNFLKITFKNLTGYNIIKFPDVL